MESNAEARGQRHRYQRRQQVTPDLIGDIDVSCYRRYRLAPQGNALCSQLSERGERRGALSVGGNTVGASGVAVLSPFDDSSEGESQPTGLSMFYCKSVDIGCTDLVDRKCEAASKMIDGRLYYRVKVKYDELVTSTVDYQLDLDTP